MRLLPCLALLLIGICCGHLIAAELVGPTDPPARILADPAAAAANAHALAGATAISGSHRVDWTAVLGGAVSAIVLIGGIIGGPTAQAAIRTLAAVSPWVRQHVDQADDWRTKANDGGIVIASTEVGRYGLQKLDQLVGRDERAKETVSQAIATLTDGKASTIEGLFLTGLEGHQVDAGRQTAIADWRQAILDSAPTIAGQIIAPPAVISIVDAPAKA